MTILKKIKLHFLLIFFLFGTVACNKGKNQTANNYIKTVSGNTIDFTDMDQFLESKMDSLEMPGLSIAFINDAKIVYHRALGVTNIETKEKVNDKSLFDAGSISKTPFTYLVMKMAEQGVLELNTPLYTYLPYPDIAYDERYKLITARMVLSHTSGFPNWRFFNDGGKLDIKFAPGTQFRYSGEGFEYLADVLAHLKNIERDELQGLFEKEVSIPSGMDNSYYVWTDYVTEHRVDGHVKGKPNPGWGINKEKPNFWASYSLQSEAVGYANFIIALMQEQGLEKESFDEMLKVHVETPSDKDDRSWGLGITIKPTEYGTEYGHRGDNLSFTSNYAFNKKGKTGYVFFTNCTKAKEFDEKLEAFLLHGAKATKGIY